MAMVAMLGVAPMVGAQETESMMGEEWPSYLVGRDLPAPLVELQRAGRIAEAEAWLDAQIPGGARPQDPLVVERERLRRLRRDFSLTTAQMLEAVRASIPEATEADLETWRTAGVLQGLRIDGETRYFRKEPRNLFRLSADARARRDAAAGPAAPAPTPEGDPNTARKKQSDLHEHVLSLLDGSTPGNEFPGAIRVTATHTVTVKPGAVPEGETIRVWIPFPQEYRQQREVELLSVSPGNPQVAPNGAAHRTVYLEAPAPAADQPAEFSITYRYTTSGYVPALDPERVLALSPDHPMLAEHGEARPPHVDITPELRALARDIVGEEQNPLLAARRIFGWMNGKIRYCSEMEYSIITSISDKALSTTSGDCGVQVLLFVSLCRAAGIPARWQSGWAMRPGSENLHDWAEIYIEPYGWLPVDPSYGMRDHADGRVREFYFGHIDAWRMIANLDYEAEFDPPKTFWRSDNIDNQRGEVEWRGGNLYYDQWSYKMKAEYEELAQ